jgi:hypothetical protein
LRSFAVFAAQDDVENWPPTVSVCGGGGAWVSVCVGGDFGSSFGLSSFGGFLVSVVEEVSVGAVVSVGGGPPVVVAVVSVVFVVSVFVGGFVRCVSRGGGGAGTAALVIGGGAAAAGCDGT